MELLVWLSVAFPAARRIEFTIANSPAHCGAPALVPPTWNHPFSPFNKTVLYAGTPLDGEALYAMSGTALLPEESRGTGKLDWYEGSSSYLESPPPLPLHPVSLM